MERLSFPQYYSGTRSHSLTTMGARYTSPYHEEVSLRGNSEQKLVKYSDIFSREPFSRLSLSLLIG